MKAQKFEDVKIIKEDIHTKKDCWAINNQDGEVKSLSVESAGYLEPEDVLMEYKEQNELQNNEELFVYKISAIEYARLSIAKRDAILNSAPYMEGEENLNPFIPLKDSEHSNREYECMTQEGKVKKKVGETWQVVDIEANAARPGSFMHELRKALKEP